MSVRICVRCGKEFDPSSKKTAALLFGDKGSVSKPTCCAMCQLRNLYDGLEFPTPPALLDYWTKNPCLTDAEYKEKVGKIGITVFEEPPK